MYVIQNQISHCIKSLRIVFFIFLPAISESSIPIYMYNFIRQIIQYIYSHSLMLNSFSGLAIVAKFFDEIKLSEFSVIPQFGRLNVRIT